MTIEQQTTEGYHCPRCGAHIPPGAHHVCCEPLSSNPLRFDQGGCAEPDGCYVMYSDYERLATQIEAHRSNEVDSENTRLRAAVQKQGGETLRQGARAEGLHTALELIVSNGGFGSDRCFEIAREALAGAADETDDCPRSTDGRHEFGCIKCGEPAESATAQEADHRHCYWPGERHGMDHKCAKCGRLDREHACPCWKLDGQETNNVL